MNAIAVLQIDPALVRQALPALDAGDAEAERRRGANGEPVRVRALENATLVHLDAPLTEDPEVLGALLAMRVGDVLAAHAEPRGVPVYPESYALAATTWDAAVAELGDGADWIPLGGGAPALPDLAAMLGPDAAAQFAGFTEHLQSEQGAAMFQQAMQMAQQLAGSGALAGLAEKMSGATTPEEALSQAGADPAMLGGLDLGAMMAQAQSMLAANPDLERQLREQLGGMLGADEGDDDESE